MKPKLDTMAGVLEWADTAICRANRTTTYSSEVFSRPDTETAAYLAECVRVREAWRTTAAHVDKDSYAFVSEMYEKIRAMAGGK